MSNWKTTRYSFRLFQQFLWLTSLYFCVSLKRLSKFYWASHWQQSDFVEQLVLLKAGFCFRASGNLENACQALDTQVLHPVVSLAPFECPKPPTVIGKNSESTTFQLSAGSWMVQNLKAEAVFFTENFIFPTNELAIVELLFLGNGHKNFRGKGILAFLWWIFAQNKDIFFFRITSSQKH